MALLLKKQVQRARDLPTVSQLWEPPKAGLWNLKFLLSPLSSWLCLYSGAIPNPLHRSLKAALFSISPPSGCAQYFGQAKETLLNITLWLVCHCPCYIVYSYSVIWFPLKPTFLFKWPLIVSRPQLQCSFVSEKVRTLASAGGPDNLVLLDPGKYKAKSRSPGSPAGEGPGSPPKWLIGEQEFEALMRMLDNLVRTPPPLDVKGFFLKAQCWRFCSWWGAAVRL